MYASRPSSTARRADLDWIRVGAFGLLILYHVGLVYAPWDWHVKSPHTIEALRYGALVANPWRLTLLFLVSGAALRFMARRQSPAAGLRQRFARLAPPFAFGVLVLVPPQAWLEARDKFGWTQGLGEWWLAQFSPAGVAAGIPLNHLWFVLYIGAYSVPAILLLSWPTVAGRLEAALARALDGWRLLVLPFVYLTLVRHQLFADHGVTNHLLDDPYNHAMSLGVFLFGFLLATRDEVWRTFERHRWVALAAAATALPLLIVAEARAGTSPLDLLVRNALFAADQWATICAALGFASRHLRNADGPVLRYLTNAVFPCYLAHQTVLVVFAHMLRPAALPLAAEAPLLVAVTVLGSLGIYEAVRRVDPIRPLWGLKPIGGAPSAPVREPAAAPEPAAG